MGRNLVANRDLHVEPVQRLGVGADRAELRARPLLPDRIGQRLDAVAPADLRGAPHHLARGVEQDAGLVTRDRGGVALGAALAIEKAEIERERRGDRGLAVAARHVDHRLAEPARAGLALDEAEQIGEHQPLPRHQSQRASGFGTFDVRHQPGEDHRALGQIRHGMPRSVSGFCRLKITQKPRAGELHEPAGCDRAREHVAAIGDGAGHAHRDRSAARRSSQPSKRIPGRRAVMFGPIGADAIALRGRQRQFGGELAGQLGLPVQHRQDTETGSAGRCSAPSPASPAPRFCRSLHRHRRVPCRVARAMGCRSATDGSAPRWPDTLPVRERARVALHRLRAEHVARCRRRRQGWSVISCPDCPPRSSPRPA